MQYLQNISERFCLSGINVCKLYRVRGFFKAFLNTPWYRASRNILALTLSQLSFGSLTFIRSFVARNTTSVLDGGKHKPDFVYSKRLPELSIQSANRFEKSSSLKCYKRRSDNSPYTRFTHNVKTLKLLHTLCHKAIIS